MQERWFPSLLFFLIFLDWSFVKKLSRAPYRFCSQSLEIRLLITAFIAASLFMPASAAPGTTPPAAAKTTTPYKSPYKDADVLAQVKKSKEYFKQFRYKEASDILEPIVKANPSSALRHILAEVMVRQGRYQKAVEQYLECTLDSPNDFEARVAIGQIYIDTGRFADAAAVYRQVLRKTNDNRYRRQAQDGLERIEEYNAMGNMNAANYLSDDIHEHFKPSDFPLKIAIWVDPELRKYRETFKDAVHSSFKKWSDASGGKLTFQYVENQKDARIICKLTGTMRGSRFVSHGIKLGETLRDTDDGATMAVKFSRVEVFFDTDDDPNSIPDITLHEVGHALGINHSNNPRDIMFPFARHPFAALLTERDKNTLKALYGI
jgi:tetratricopeptide (TPR) repeat protein